MIKLGRLSIGRNERLEDWLPWLMARDEARGIILTATGGFLRVARIIPPDLETASFETLTAHHARIAKALSRLGSGWSAWIDQWRVRTTAYLPASDFGGNHAARLIDDARRRLFEGDARPAFVNSAFLAVHYGPRGVDDFLALLEERDDPGGGAAATFFREATDALFGELRHTMDGVEDLSGDGLASYLAASVDYRPGFAMMPATPPLARQMAACEWTTAPRLCIDGRHLATVEVLNFGSPSPMTCEALHELPFEARWVTTLHALDAGAQRGELGEVRKRWMNKRKGLVAILTEAITRNPFAGRVDPEAERAVAQLDVLAAELVERPFALAHANVHVWGATRAEADERAGTVVSLLNARGFRARRATLNDVFAPMGDMPGNVAEEVMNVRRARLPLGIVTRVAPVTGVSTGAREDRRFGGPALLMAGTRRSVPLHWSLNAPGSDNAHTAVVGRTGAGKSALLAFMAAQFLRYENASVILFDRRRSFLVPCLALGGDWIELGDGGAGVQPLRAVHRPEERAWALEWVLRALRTAGLPIRPHTRTAVATALGHVADLPPDRRTLSGLHTYLAADAEARDALTVYLAKEDGNYGALFDGVVPSYGSAPVLGIETENVIQLRDAAPLVIAAVFRAVRRDRLGGDAPKLVLVDEAWSLLQSDLFAGEIEGWAREMRKLKAVLCLASQSLADFAAERTRVIFDQMANRVYLPHAEALRPQTAELYRKVGLEEEQIRLLAHATPKAEYLLQTEQVTRLITLRLEDEALALCGASTPADHARARELLAAGAVPGEAFTRAWLAESTAAWLAGRTLTFAEAAE